jgi:uncharacterized membrane protein YwaF
VEAAPASNGPLIWSYNPWKERAGLTWALCGVNCAVSAIAYISLIDDPSVIVFALLAALCMFGMTLSLLVPISYRMDERGVTVSFLGTNSFRPWSHYRNIYVHSNGVFLTSMDRPSKLDPFRGHFMLIQKDNREKVTTYARQYIQT